MVQFLFQRLLNNTCSAIIIPFLFSTGALDDQCADKLYFQIYKYITISSLKTFNSTFFLMRLRSLVRQVGFPFSLNNAQQLKRLNLVSVALAGLVIGCGYALTYSIVLGTRARFYTPHITVISDRTAHSKKN